MKLTRIVLLTFLCLSSDMALAGAKCRASNGQLLHSETVCPVGTVVEEYTVMSSAQAAQLDSTMPKLSINIKNSDLRTLLQLLGEEMFPGRLFLDNAVTGTIDLREFDIPVDKLFQKVLQMKRLEVMKIKHNYYVFPSAIGRNVAASTAALKGL